MELLQTVFPGWPQAIFLLISASQVGRITGMSHQCLVISPLFKSKYASTNFHPWAFNI
jgi:hypothetical protein